jgi:LacI family transcriptional regulator
LRAFFCGGKLSVTLADIAKLANISESAVSRALQNNPRISEATRKRVKKLAIDLDFEYNAHARSLSTQRCETIGVILPNYGIHVNHTYYLELLINDLRFQLASHNYDMLICDSEHYSSVGTNLSRLVRQRKVDGLIIVVGDLPEKDRKVIEAHNIPMVLVNSRSITMSGKSFDGVSSFFTDNIQGGKLAARHLVERGCQRFICLADQGATPEMLDRTAGFSAGLAEFGFVPQVLTCESFFPVTQAYLKEHLETIRGGDGIFCHMDLMACALLKTLHEVGIRVPEDIKVVGYDDIEIGTYFTPQLTTIHQPREAIAEQAVRDLIQRLVSPGIVPVTNVSVSPRLELRGST